MTELEDMVISFKIKEKALKKSGDLSSAACFKALADFTDALDATL